MQQLDPHLAEAVARVFDGFCHEGRPVIFCFGSNLAGIHGKGAALDATKWYGAQRGVGRGMTGQAYALPTKYAAHLALPIDAILNEIGTFTRFVSTHTTEWFMVTRIGCGLAGHANQESLIARAFLEAPQNCLLPGTWVAIRQPDITRLHVALPPGFDNYPWLTEKLGFYLGNRAAGEIEIVVLDGQDPLPVRYALEHGFPVMQLSSNDARHGSHVDAGALARRRLLWYCTHLLVVGEALSVHRERYAQEAAGEGLVVRHCSHP